MSLKLILPIFAAVVSFAQPPGMGPGRGQGRTPQVDELKAYLSLTDTQVTSITTALRTAAEGNRAFHEQIRTKHQTLQSALDSGSADAPAIGRMMLEIQALRKQAESNHTKAREQAASFLTAEQKAKLKTLEEAKALSAELRQAQALQLLAPSANGRGPGSRGMGRMSGPHGRGGHGGANIRQ